MGSLAIVPAILLTVAALGAGQASAQSLSPIYGNRGSGAGSRPTPPPSIYSRHVRPTPFYYAPAYRQRTTICRTRIVRDRNGDRIVERQVRVCRERW